MAKEVPKQTLKLEEENTSTQYTEEVNTTSICYPPGAMRHKNSSLSDHGTTTSSGGNGDDAYLNTPESSQADASDYLTDYAPIRGKEGNILYGNVFDIEANDNSSNFAGQALGRGEPISIADRLSLNDSHFNSNAILPTEPPTATVTQNVSAGSTNPPTTQVPTVQHILNSDHLSNLPPEGTEYDLLPFSPCGGTNGNSLPVSQMYCLPSTSAVLPIEIPASAFGSDVYTVTNERPRFSRESPVLSALKNVRASKRTCDVHSQTDKSSMQEESSKLSSEQKGGKWTFVFFWALLLNHTGGDTLVRWISQEKFVFQVVEGCTKRVSDIWGRLDTSPYHPSWDNLTGRIRYSLKKKEGYFIDFYKDSEFQQMPRKRCFRFFQHIDQMVQVGKVHDTQFRRMQIDIEKYFLQMPIV